MEVVRYHDGTGNRVALLVKQGHKFAHLVVIDHPIKVLRVKKAELRYTWPMDLSVTETAHKMLTAGERMGMNVGAERLLREALV